MTVRSTDPIWKDTLKDLPGPPLAGNLSCDVCVVGAGIAGLTAAYLLSRAGRQVVLIDARRTVGGGETPMTTAHLASVIDDRFFEVARVRGAEAARLAHQSHAAAIDLIESVCRLEGIQCGFRRVEGVLFPSPGDAKLIDREYEAARAAGCAVERLADVPVPTLGHGPCLRFSNQATFEPSRYMSGLWAILARRQVRFFADTRARDVTGGTPAVVETDRDASIRANAVLVCTNTPFHKRVSMHTKLAAYSTYAVAGPVPRGSFPDGLFWDTQDPYHYIRLVTSQDSGKADTATDTLVVGGADHRTGHDTNPARRWTDLEEWTRERVPQFQGATHRWSGMVMETLDGLGYIGASPGRDQNVYLCTGDSGMGLTHGTIAGILLTDLILGRPNPWTSLYDPARFPLRAAGEFASEGMSSSLPYTDWVTGGDVSSIEEIAPGCGAVVRKGFTKLAVYRDPAGALHTRSAVCPHLGGLVRWNEAEQTWDCPCHGSRFQADGRLLHGPAHEDLESADA